MKLRTRFGVTIATAVLGTLGVLGLAACSPSQAAAAAMSPEATALTTLGFSDHDVAADNTDATATPTASAPSKPRRPALKRLLIRRAAIAKHVEHGSVTVQTKNGTETIDVQRGTITALGSTSVTVKSADGFTLTWTFGDKMRVIENRATIQPSAVKVGETVGVAGEKSGSTENARLVVIPKQ